MMCEQGYLSVNYSDNYYLLSQRFEEVPRLTPAHYEAMALFNELASSRELRLEMILQPGDIQLLNNHTCLHYRSAFVDFPVCCSIRAHGYLARTTEHMHCMEHSSGKRSCCIPANIRHP